MRANERLNEIVKLLNRQGRVHVKDLSKTFNVSEDLIRKDLKKLEDKGLIDRIYGGAERKSKKFDASNIKYRMNIHKESKEKITKKVEKLIENGDTIFLDTSSTSLTLATLLKSKHKELTVITNMLEVVRILEDNNDIRTILIGGLYNRMLGGFVGHGAIETIQSYYVDKAFVSCMSLRLEDGVLISSTSDIGATKRAILNQAERKILMMETRKFQHKGTVKFYDMNDLDILVTEKALSNQEKTLIKDYNIQII